MSQQILIASKNPGKVREIAQVLEDMDVQILGLDKLHNIPEPEETGATFSENACQKAQYYAQATGVWCLADDSGLAVDALNGDPGVYSARYAAENCEPQSGREILDAANNQKLMTQLKNIPEEKRTARFVCHLALADPNKILLETNGIIEGRILTSPRGKNGFGYDPLFFVPEMGCTTAELSPEDKNRISHRGRAVRAIAGKLASLLT